MKLVRFGEKGKEKPGVLGADGNIRDASSLVADWNGENLRPAVIKKVAAAAAGLPLAKSGARLGAPVAAPGKIIGIGLNYRAHAAEAGAQPPTDPIIFLKSPTALSGPFDNIVLPKNSVNADWEVELAVVIGTGGVYIDEANALSHVAGYAVANDVSEREFQLRRGPQWTKGKSADTFAPIGPWLVTANEVADPQNLRLVTKLNGKTMQDGNTADMIFPIAALISRVSSYMRLCAGDIMITGTPPGVGLGQKPPRYLRPDDRLQLAINGLGEQDCRVCAAP